MFARTLLTAGALLLGAAYPAGARELSIGLPTGAASDALRKAFVKPFVDSTGIAVSEAKLDGALTSVRERKEGAPEPLDVVVMRGDELAAGCEDGTFERLDWSRMGGRDQYIAQATSDCGVAAAVFAYVLAWDKDKFPATPTWADFWDVTKYPGKRGLRRGPETNLEFALIADGVAPGDVYRTLRTNDGLDRAFRKLDQLRPYIVWWRTSGEAAKFLGSGDVLMTSATSPQIFMANHAPNRNFGMQWTASLATMESWAILRGSANLRQAYQFFYFAGSSAIQARLLSTSGFGGSAKATNDSVPPEVAAAAPMFQANFGGFAFDEQFWRENRDKLTQRFEQWLNN